MEDIKKYRSCILNLNILLIFKNEYQVRKKSFKVRILSDVKEVYKEFICFGRE